MDKKHGGTTTRKATDRPVRQETGPDGVPISLERQTRRTEEAADIYRRNGWLGIAELDAAAATLRELQNLAQSEISDEFRGHEMRRMWRNL